MVQSPRFPKTIQRAKNGETAIFGPIMEIPVAKISEDEKENLIDTTHPYGLLPSLRKKKKIPGWESQHQQSPETQPLP